MTHSIFLVYGIIHFLVDVTVGFPNILLAGRTSKEISAAVVVIVVMIVVFGACSPIFFRARALRILTMTITKDMITEMELKRRRLLVEMASEPNGLLLFMVLFSAFYLHCLDFDRKAK